MPDIKRTRTTLNKIDNRWERRNTKKKARKD